MPLVLVGLVFFATRTLWCGSPARVTLAGETMGTTWTVTLNAPGSRGGDRSRARAAIESRLAAVNATMSTWDRESELSRFNRTASTEPIAVSPELLAVMLQARAVSEASGGAFDVTVRPLVAAFGFGAGAKLPGEGPDASELARLRARVGYHKLVLDPEAGSARKAVPGLEVDLSAIAKGHGVDEVALALEELGHADFLVEIGGEVRARGQRPGGGPWRLAIERPDPEGRSVHAVVELRDRAMATSGDYRDFYEAGGERLTHILDPRLGRPVAHGLASVSVVHDSAELADAWATALTVLGPESGPALAERLGLGAYFIARGPGGAFEGRATPAFPERLGWDDEPAAASR